MLHAALHGYRKRHFLSLWDRNVLSIRKKDCFTGFIIKPACYSDIRVISFHNDQRPASVNMNDDLMSGLSVPQVSGNNINFMPALIQFQMLFECHGLGGCFQKNGFAFQSDF